MSDAERAFVDRLAHLEAANQRLQAENDRLRVENDRLRVENDRLRVEVARLQGLLGASERSGKRQAAPFSRNKPKAERKKNGRKAGDQHGRHGHRPVPPETAIDETHYAPLPATCPHGGHDHFDDVETVEQFQDDLPRRPIHRKIVIHKGTCGRCHRSVQGRHPLQTSDATGACASQVGPTAQAAVVYLNKHAGLSYTKISDAFDKLHGLTISRGACCQIVLRAADRLAPALDEIHEVLKTSEHVTPDETGWRVGGQPAWLHVCVGDLGATSFTIDSGRAAAVLGRVIGMEWSGTMTHDGYASYDRFETANHQQCVDHAMRRAEHLAECFPEDTAFPTRVVEIFRGALRERDRRVAGASDDAELYRWHEEYVRQLLELTTKDYENEEYRRFAKHLFNHGEQWFLFLIDATIPATNHRAEQALKTPIVNRKVFGGNQTPAGARAQEVVSSVLATCQQQAIDFVAYVSQSFCGCVASLFAG